MPADKDEVARLGKEWNKARRRSIMLHDNYIVARDRATLLKQERDEAIAEETVAYDALIAEAQKP